MTVAQLIQIIDGKLLNDQANTGVAVACGYTCDLLSWVMANGKPEMAWITVQTHMNVLAVATLMDFSCVIIPEDIAVEDEVLQRANREGLAVISSRLSAYALCALMAEHGISAG